VADCVDPRQVLIWDLRFFVRSMTDVEARLNAVDRLQEYAQLTTELPRVTDEDNFLPSLWPTAGTISISNLRMRYRKDLPLVLRGINIDIPAGTSVGIVGRTGSGKSSLVSTLFRLVDWHSGTSGTVTIDGVPIDGVGLATLRSALMIVPQDPVLYSGTVRTNLDPFVDFEDDELWTALEACSLGELVRSMQGQLASAVMEGGANWSTISETHGTGILN
jgi:ABC-type multidrug transport system fused ATPase/permease subunit